jgi:predicted nucleic acid-binding protein
MTLVPDASVVIKWFVPEAGSDAARALLDAGHDFVAPDLLFAEVANTLWKKTRLGELSTDEAAALLEHVGDTAIEGVSIRDLVDDALVVAARTGRTVYDALYLATAVRLQTVMVTADQRLLDAVTRFPLLAVHIEHVAQFGRRI